MLLSHTPTGAAAPDLVFCARLPVGHQHIPAIRLGAASPCPQPCALTCVLQAGACVAPPPLPARLVLTLNFSATLVSLLEEGLLPPMGCVIGRN
jgi:hypothetical protein